MPWSRILHPVHSDLVHIQVVAEDEAAAVDVADAASQLLLAGRGPAVTSCALTSTPSFHAASTCSVSARIQVRITGRVLEMQLRDECLREVDRIQCCDAFLMGRGRTPDDQQAKAETAVIVVSVERI